MYNFLRTTALTSLICFSSSAVYAMAEDPSASSGTIYRTTGSKSELSFKLELAEVDPALPLKVKINHRSPGREKTHVMLFDPNDNKYVKLAKMERSYDFITTSYRLDLEDTEKLYSYFDHLKQPIMLKLSFQGGESDIHSIKLIQHRSSEKKVLQSVVLGDTKSEGRPEVLMLFPEMPNQWSAPETLTPRSSFSSSDVPIFTMTSAISEALQLERRDKKQALRKLISDQTVPFSDRLNVALAVAKDAVEKDLGIETATFLLSYLMDEKNISSSDRLKVAKVAESMEEGQGISLLSQFIKNATLSFSDRFAVARFVGEAAFFKLAKDQFNGSENRASAVEHLKGAMKIIADRRLQEDGGYKIISSGQIVSSAPSSSSSSSTPAVPASRLDALSCYMGQPSFPYATRGFSAFEGTHRWTEGTEAEIIFPLKTMSPRPFRVSFLNTRALVTGSYKQHLLVKLNGRMVGHYTYTLSDNNKTIEFPLEHDDSATITFETLNAISPFDLEINADKRKLGISFREAKLQY
ncbi:MAG: hypothetical protein K2X02_01415 [Alphaproteobacteria bacterium]|nr:hypothetical protein [Alphaproteobacteria bacterium]